MKASHLLVVELCVVAAAACGKCAAPLSPGPAAGKVAAPTASSPSDGAQLTSLRPTLSVGNAPAGTSGTRTYEFQVSDKSDFSSSSSTGSFPTLARQTGVAEGSAARSNSARKTITLPVRAITERNKPEMIPIQVWIVFRIGFFERAALLAMAV